VTGSAGAGLRSGQIAAAAGVNVETLRYYERRGLLAAPHRSPGGHRLYDSASVTTLRVIKAAQRLGFTLEEVAELLEVDRHRHRPRSTHPGDAGLHARAQAKLVEVEERITDLFTIRDNLREALDAGCDDLIACAGTDCCPIPFATITTRPGAAAPQDRSGA
jgi:DNA-binding transcriptional MerR regulator